MTAQEQQAMTFQEHQLRYYSRIAARYVNDAKHSAEASRRLTEAKKNLRRIEETLRMLKDYQQLSAKLSELQETLYRKQLVVDAQAMRIKELMG